jgi:flagellar biosynthesis protein FliR
MFASTSCAGVVRVRLSMMCSVSLASYSEFEFPKGTVLLREEYTLLAISQGLLGLIVFIIQMCNSWPE